MLPLVLRTVAYSLEITQDKFFCILEVCSGATPEVTHTFTCVNKDASFPQSPSSSCCCLCPLESFTSNNKGDTFTENWKFSASASMATIQRKQQRNGHFHPIGETQRCCADTAFPREGMHIVGTASSPGTQGASEEASSLNGIKHTLVADHRT